MAYVDSETHVFLNGQKMRHCDLRRVLAARDYTLHLLRSRSCHPLEYDIMAENSGNGIESVDPFRMKQVDLVSSPMPFRVVFKVRSLRRELTIRRTGASSREATDEIMNRIQAGVAGAKVV